MPAFADKEAAKAFIRDLPGFVAGSLKETGNVLGYESLGGGEFVESAQLSYAQSPPSSPGAYRTRLAILQRTYTTSEEGDEEDLGFDLKLPAVAESPEGAPLTVAGFGGPGEFYPFCFSLELRAARGASDDPVNADHSPCGEGDTPAFYRTTAYRLVEHEVGFQNIVACWARCNEGDHADFSVEAPIAFDGLGQPTAWAAVAKFADRLSLFGTNPAGTYYPPNMSPSLSWIPAGCRLRLDFYKKATNDPELEGTRGPFVELDILTQRRRVEA